MRVPLLVGEARVPLLVAPRNHSYIFTMPPMRKQSKSFPFHGTDPPPRSPFPTVEVHISLDSARSAAAACRRVDHDRSPREAHEDTGSRPGRDLSGFAARFSRREETLSGADRLVGSSSSRGDRSRDRPFHPPHDVALGERRNTDPPISDH